MGGRQCGSCIRDGLVEHPEHGGEGDGTFDEELAEGAAGDVLHDQVGAVTLHARFVDRNDVGVLHLGQRAGFGEQLVRVRHAREQFQRDVPFEQSVPCLSLTNNSELQRLRRIMFPFLRLKKNQPMSPRY